MVSLDLLCSASALWSAYSNYQHNEHTQCINSLPIVHTSPASTGEVFSSISLPYKQRPASKRSESRAPNPAGFTSGCFKSSLFNTIRRHLRKYNTYSARCTAIFSCTLISKPSSPVYPQRVTYYISSHTHTSFLGPNLASRNPRDGDTRKVSHEFHSRDG